MTYLNPICADVGTRNCPCPLAETGDCLVCSRLAAEHVIAGGQASVFITSTSRTGAKSARGGRIGAPRSCKDSGAVMIWCCCSLPFLEALLWRHPNRGLFYFSKPPEHRR